MKRILVMVLVLGMVLGAVPFGVFAEEESAQTEQALASRKNSNSSSLLDAAAAFVSSDTEEAVSVESGPVETYNATAAVNKPADGTTNNEPFSKGTGGSNSFRIPALVTLSDGTLVAAADARWNTTYDGGGLDTVVSRSTDNGATWNYTFANYLGDNGNVYNGSSSSCFIDPALAVTANDTIYMLVDLYPYGIALNGEGNTAPSTSVGFNSAGHLLLSADNHSTYGYYLNLTDYKIYASGGTAVEGYTVDKYFNITGTDGTSSNLFFVNSPYKVVRTGFLYLTKSTDQGATWSAPTLLNLKTSSEQVCLVSPGRGLVTSSGMIVFPVYSYNTNSVTGTVEQQMGFIYSNNNGATWSRSSSFTGATWSSEAAVVELTDGTLRFFYRNGTAELYYADYKDGAWGDAEETGIAINSNCQISAITYSKTIDGKQVILVSCPTGPNETGSNQSSAENRLNGKIFVFTVESGTNALPHNNAHRISVTSKHSTTNYFMYSCLTELEDGTVALLYEDNQAGWGTGDDKYYQMSYAEYDLATSLQLTFDEETDTDTDTDTDTPNANPIYTITDTPTSVTVNFAPTDVTGWTMTVTANQSVTGLTEYAAYNVTITDDEGNAYTGAAEVKMPLTGISNTADAYPFVLTGGNVEKINGSVVKNGYITFTAPHFSVVGVAVDASTIIGEDTINTVNTGTATTYELANDELDSGAQYLIVYQDGSTATEGLALNTSKGSVAVTIADGKATPAGDVSAALWTYTTSGNNRYLSVGTDYLYPNRTGDKGRYSYSLEVGTQTSVTIKSQGNGAYQVCRTWQGRDSVTRYVVYNNGWGVQSDGQDLYFYKYTEGNAVTEYTITPTLSESKITAYTITDGTGYTEDSWNAYQAALSSAQEKLQGVQGITYSTEQDAEAARDELVAAVEALETAKNALVQVVTVTVYYQHGQNQIATETFSVAENTETITLPAKVKNASGAVYKVEDTKLTLTGLLTYVVPVVPFEYTIRYVDLYVGQSKTDTVLNQSYTEADVTQQPDTDIATLDSVTNGTMALKELVEITDETLASGGQYLIVNAQTGEVLTNTAIAVSSSAVTWGKRIGLDTKSVETELLPYITDQLWTITGTADSYTVTMNGDYLGVAGYYAHTTDTETSLTLKYTASGWTIYDTFTKSSGEDNKGPDGNVHEAAGYYLHDGVGNGYSGGALGNATVITDNGSTAGYWKIYKIVEDADTEISYTDVTFTGEKEGQTIVLVGDHKFVVTVHEAMTITVNYQLNGNTIKTEKLSMFADATSVTLDRYVLDGENKLYTVDDTTLALTQGITEYQVPVSQYAGTSTAITMQAGATQEISATLTDGQYVTWYTADGDYVGVAGGYDKDTVGEETIYVSNEKATLAAHAETAADSPVNVIGLIHNADGTVVGTQVWEVTVSGVTSNVNSSTKNIKITSSWIEHSTVYYSINGGALQEITADMLDGPFTGDNGATYYSLKEPLINQQYTTGFQILIFAAPDPGYALTFLESTNSDGEYYSLVGGGPDGVGSAAWPLQDAYTNGYDTYFANNKDSSGKVDGNNATVFDTEVGMRWGLAQGNISEAQLKVLYASAIEQGCTGVMCFTKNDDNGDLESDMKIVSEKIATVEKTVQGILPKGGAERNFRPYEDGMVAGTHDLVFFSITLELERPTAWKDNDEAAGIAALEYTKATLTDNLEGCYFYDQALDLADGTWDGVIDWTSDAVKNYDLTTASETTKAVHASGTANPADYRSVNIVDALNEAWAADELTRTVTFSVVYEIRDEDIPKYTITNSVNFAYSFNSAFSVAKDEEAATSTLARVTVVTKPMDNILIDFTHPVTITGLTNDHLKYAFEDDDKDLDSMKAWYKAPEANYGTVSVSKEQQLKDGKPQYDGNGYPLYDYTLTYTPDPAKGIMQAQDVVRIYGTFIDTNTGLQVTKLINAFAVYPTTTIYYEEDYVTWGTGWTQGGAVAFADREEQHLDYLGDTVTVNNVTSANKLYNYGYDPVYVGDDHNAASGGTQASTSTYGASGSFNFKGTGFEIYANCTESTGYVMVLVKNAAGKTWLYTVNTAVGKGTSGATAGQTGEFYSVPILSVQDLEFGSYTVTIIKSVDVVVGQDGTTSTAETPKPVHIDGIRIFGTVENQSIYMTDGEDDPTFVELRDQVLAGIELNDLDISDVEEGSEYYDSVGTAIMQQVYDSAGTTAGAVLLSDTSGWDLKDLLDNGPKNELYLYKNQSVTFALSNGITAQVGMKTVQGKTTYTLTSAGATVATDAELNSSTDMFYHTVSGQVTITNTGDEIVSITLLKLFDVPENGVIFDTVETNTVAEAAVMLMSLRRPEAAEAKLNVTVADYTGTQLATVELIQSGAAGETAVFAAADILAAVEAQLPEGYGLAEETADVQVVFGEEANVTLLAGKVATLKVNYVVMYNRTFLSLGGRMLPLPGRKTVTVTLTKVQTAEGDAVFTAADIRAAAPRDTVVRGVQSVEVAYGQTATRTFFGTQTNQSLLLRKANWFSRIF